MMYVLMYCLYIFFQERFVIQVTDLLTVSMMLGITAQVKEAGIAWDKGEKKSKMFYTLNASYPRARLHLVTSCVFTDLIC